jgi:acyl dehydratase
VGERATEKEYFEDCQIGEKGVTPGRTITETDVVMFAAFTGDWYQLHTNVEFAKASVFGERIAHGLLALVVGNGLIFRLGEYALLPQSTIAITSLEKVRFVAPTKIGDTLHLESEVVKLTEIDAKRGIVVVKNRIKNQHNQNVILCTVKVLVGRRPPG